jgi:hypothetical protein
MVLPEIAAWALNLLRQWLWEDLLVVCDAECCKGKIPSLWQDLLFTQSSREIQEKYYYSSREILIACDIRNFMAELNSFFWDLFYEHFHGKCTSEMAYVGELIAPKTQGNDRCIKMYVIYELEMLFINL